MKRQNVADNFCHSGMTVRSRALMMSPTDYCSVAERNDGDGDGGVLLAVFCHHTCKSVCIGQPVVPDVGMVPSSCPPHTAGHVSFVVVMIGGNEVIAVRREEYWMRQACHHSYSEWQRRWWLLLSSYYFAELLGNYVVTMMQEHHQ